MIDIPTLHKIYVSPHVILLDAFHEILKNVTQIVDTVLRSIGDGRSVNVLDMYIKYA